MPRINPATVERWLRAHRYDRTEAAQTARSRALATVDPEYRNRYLRLARRIERAPFTYA